MPTAVRRKTASQDAADAKRDGRQFLVVAIIFTLAIAILTGVYVVANDATDPPTPATGAAQQRAEPALDVPDGGHKPKSPGDRGGSEQLALMGGLTVALVGGAAWVISTSRRAQRRQGKAAVGTASGEREPSEA